MRMNLLMLVLTVAVLTGCFGTSGPMSSSPGNFEMRILGQNQVLAGGGCSIRVLTYNPGTLEPVSGIPIFILFETSPGKQVRLAEGKSNSAGTYDAQFTMPAELKGSGKIVVKAGEGAAQNVLSSSVQVIKRQKIFLSTDKPLYQPGQRVHIRALCMQEPGLLPIANRDVILEVQDSKGNKVFKRGVSTSKFGVAAVEFDLATEVNMGEYHLKAILDEDTAEKSFTVKKYVLPKFRIKLATEKSFYLPGEKVKGSIQADYFFGKPVSKGKVLISFSTFDVAFKEVARLEGTTGVDGAYFFDFTLPSYFVGQPLQKGEAFFKIKAILTDTANHKEESTTTVPVVHAPILINILPESGNLIPNVENRIYILTSYPDGNPARTELEVKLPDTEAKASTDGMGFAQVFYTPKSKKPADTVGSPGIVWEGRHFEEEHIAVQKALPYGKPYSPPVPIEVKARDEKGNESLKKENLSVQGGTEGILVRPDRALYRVGETLTARIYTSKKKGFVYVDFIREGQTILTQSVEVQNGRGELRVHLSSDAFGSLILNAYQILSTSDTIRDTRRILVHPAKDLSIGIRMSKEVYRPGEESEIGFQVKDRTGRPTAAAIGVDIVDESLFALAEKQPGLERVYFLLEKELMEPRYEIHGFSVSEAARDVQYTEDLQKQELSQALFSKLPKEVGYPISMDTYAEKMRQVLEKMGKIRDALYQFRSRHGRFPGWEGIRALVRDGFLKEEDITDPWGSGFILKAKDSRAFPEIICPGQDRREGTGDDLCMRKLYRDLAGAGVLERPAVLFEIAAAPGKFKREGAEAMATPEAPVPSKGGKGAGEKPVRVREYFPETLYSNPQVITDDQGVATLKVPMADSITTWRLTSFASSTRGEMGNATSGIRVFQDFFIDLDLPVALTQNDRISLPVAVYNYLPESQKVELTMEKGDWFELLEDTNRKTVTLAKNEVSVVYFRMKVKKIGIKTLTVTARGSRESDAIKKSIEVVPDGKQFEKIFSDRLTRSAEVKVAIPEAALDGASKILVTIYPGIFSQVVEGLESILRMPGGCFEQTSSSTYPNVLVLDYLQKMKKTNPEIQMKAEGYINAGYQRLLTFEVPGGGFSVFGQVPANPILTAYGLMEFSDMAKVHDVDPNLIQRTRAWLLSKQISDGSWGAGREGFYAEGWQNTPNSALPATAYITWGILESGEKNDPKVKSAVEYIKKHLGEATDPYTMALCACALASYDPRDSSTEKALRMLLTKKKEANDAIHFSTSLPTAAYGTGAPADIETTALAAISLLKAEKYQNDANKIITYLVRSKDSYGTWHSTQATVLAMKALVLSIEKATEKVNAEVSLSVNGKTVQGFRITPDDYDVFRQFDLAQYTRKGVNVVKLDLVGEGNCLYKVVGRYYMPWEKVVREKSEILDIQVSYDRAELSLNDTVTAKVLVRNLSRKTANMVMLDLGVPPGFEVQTGDFQEMVGSHKIQRYTLTGRQIIVYIEKIAPESSLSLTYRLKAKFPIRAKVPQSRVYEYYNPEACAVSAPVLMVVK